MVRERGSGKTPPRVSELLAKAVSEKGLLTVEEGTGVGKSAISRYIKGIGEPTTATLEKLAVYFDVPVTILRGDTIFSDNKAFVNCVCDIQEGLSNLRSLLEEEAELAELNRVQAAFKDLLHLLSNTLVERSRIETVIDALAVRTDGLQAKLDKI